MKLIDNLMRGQCICSGVVITIYCSKIMKLLLCQAIFVLLSVNAQADSIRFANYYGDHMVLQRAPKSAIVWGYTPLKCEAVTVTLDGKPVQAKLTPEEKQCKWSAMLPATAAGGPHTITASSATYGKVSLSDVLFGDVWVCGGQSNMVFSVTQVFNATEEFKKAGDYPNLRLFTVQRVLSTTPLDEPPQILQNWSIASPEAVNGGSFSYFSATCWFFGRNIYDKYKVPLGLFSSNWGGTIVEAWSSPDALKKCAFEGKTIDQSLAGPNDPSVLWNAMMYPLLQMTIYGAIWYQGESNAGDPPKYNCTFPAMITDWRAKWYQTNGQTDPMFPFGFVQLAANGNSNKTNNGFPGIRWSQTASYGYVPNPAMKNVFMAVAMDLGDPTSPYGSIHPRDKQDVGMRLALAGEVVAYGEKPESIYYTGPLVDKVSVDQRSISAADVVSVTITFRELSISTKSLDDLKSPYGFELGCTSGNATTYIEGTAKGAQGANVMVEFPACASGSTATMIRYAWRDDPCVFKQCAVYSGGLPSPPFMINIT